MGWDWGWRPYVPVAERRRQAMQKIEKLKKKGQTITPVTIAGRTIAGTFWGKAWCENLEAYSDYANRLPRGRTYVRNGSVIDLQIRAGRVEAMVSGSDIYRVNIAIETLKPRTWDDIKRQCLGRISSLLDLLAGKLSRPVMEIVTNGRTGLFPSPGEMTFKCSCPDWASMCKHVAAVLYGVGARLDHAPELLFQLRNVNHGDLITHPAALKAVVSGDGRGRAIAEDELGDIFGIDIEAGAMPAPPVKKSLVRPKSAGKAVGKEAEEAALPLKRPVGRPRTAGKAGGEEVQAAVLPGKIPLRRPKSTAKAAVKGVKGAELPSKKPVGRPRSAASAALKEVEGTALSLKRPAGRPKSIDKAMEQEAQKAVSPFKMPVGRPRLTGKTVVEEAEGTAFAGSGKRPVGRPRSAGKAAAKVLEVPTFPVKRPVGRPKSIGKAVGEMIEETESRVKKPVGRPKPVVKKAVAVPEKEKKTTKIRMKAPAIKKAASSGSEKEAAASSRRPVGRQKGSIRKAESKTGSKA